MLYKKIDELVIKKWPLVKEFRSLGKEIREFRKEDPQNSHLSNESIQFIKEAEKDSGFRAYWEVQAQYNLIMARVFGENPHSEKAKSACSEIGRVFQWIKAADNSIDQMGNPSKQAEKLTQIRENLDSGEYNSSLERYLSEEQSSFSPNTIELMDSVYETEMSRINAPNDTLRMKYRGENGSVLGNLEFELMKEHQLDISDHANSFLMYQGSAGAFFDDFKDYHLDRKAGEGYAHDVRIQLLSKGIQEFKSSFQTLSKEEKRNYSNFLKLGGLYQLRELIGIQERT